MTKPLTESELAERYDDHVARLGGQDIMPAYWQLGDYFWTLWRALQEADEDDRANADC
jgi:hypothetical protein